MSPRVLTVISPHLKYEREEQQRMMYSAGKSMPVMTPFYEWSRSVSGFKFSSGEGFRQMRKLTEASYRGFEELGAASDLL